MEPRLAGSRVLVGIDFSGASERALLSAVALAESEQWELELVHVFEWDGPGFDERIPAAGAPNCLAQGEVLSLVRAARRRLAGLCSFLVGDRVPAAIRVLVGDPAIELCRAAQQSQASLLVLGAAGQRGLAAGTAGRTASRVCTSSAIPVLVVAQDPSTGEGQLLLCSSRGQLLWDSSPRGALRHRVGAGLLTPWRTEKNASGSQLLQANGYADCTASAAEEPNADPARLSARSPDLDRLLCAL